MDADTITTIRHMLAAQSDRLDRNAGTDTREGLLALGGVMALQAAIDRLDRLDEPADTGLLEWLGTLRVGRLPDHAHQPLDLRSYNDGVEDTLDRITDHLKGLE